jgi:hypothetical protein
VDSHTADNPQKKKHTIPRAAHANTSLRLAHIKQSAGIGPAMRIATCDGFEDAAFCTCHGRRRFLKKSLVFAISIHVAFGERS